jgi:hypothetical protein
MDEKRFYRQWAMNCLASKFGGFFVHAPDYGVNKKPYTRVRDFWITEKDTPVTSGTPEEQALFLCFVANAECSTR